MKSRWISPPKLHKSWLAAIWISFAGVSGILMIHTSSLDWGNVYQKESAVLEVIRGQFPYNSTGGLLIAPASWMPEDDNQETPVELVFQYQAPEAGEVSLIWGVNGWTPVAKELQPAGTVITNSVMHTLMSPQGELFIASVQVPKGASVEYGFLISKSRDGAVTSVWEEDPGWPKLPRLLEARVVEIESEVHPGLRQESPGWAEILRLLFMWVGGALAVVFTYRRMSLLNEKKAAYILLGLVVLSGFLIRLNGAYAWNDTHPKVVEWLIGDEPQYDQLARGLLQGSGFSWPGRVPGYLLWLAGIYALTGGDYSAVPYAQILLGMATILLTYLIGWRILGRLVGLLAAFWVSVSYVLIHQAFHWLSEVLYTPIVLVVALLLWKAIQHPSTARFVWTGFVVGISNLIRPTLFFFRFF